jgi:hypothetical protein
VCRYVIYVGDEAVERESWGVDSLQALARALLGVKVAAAELEYMRDESFERDLKWIFAKKPGDFGLPHD